MITASAQAGAIFGIIVRQITGTSRYQVTDRFDTVLFSFDDDVAHD
jgi:hypothetical protein